MATPFFLFPESDVAAEKGRFIATSSRPWLTVTPPSTLSRLRWVRIRYSTGLFDDPVRPLLRFRSGETDHFEVMNGAVCGSAEWIGRIPEGTTAIAISPTHRPGPFSIRIDEFVGQSRVRLALRGLVRQPFLALTAIAARLIGARNVARTWLMAANGPTPIEHYDAWFRERARLPDPDGFDAQQASPSIFAFRLLADATEATAEQLETTLRSLQSQGPANWKLTVRNRAGGAIDAATVSEPRLQVIKADHDPTFADDDLCAFIKLGDTLPPLGLAQLTQATRRHPHAVVFYGDEDTSLPDGTLVSPIFRPNWSPVLEETSSYLGFATFVRFAALRAQVGSGSDFFEPSPYSQAAQRAKPEAVRHIRRLLYRRRSNTAEPAHRPRPELSRYQGDERVAVIIPTRDRFELLSRCIDGLTKGTSYKAIEVVVVDNGSTDQRAIDLLEGLKQRPSFKVLSRPGPFNYSKLCNEAARASDAPYLVFLNNDISMADPEWLHALMKWATRSDIGAVGAKLMFPNRPFRNRLQHAGVVMGLFGLASHAYHNAPRDEAGYLGMLTVPHEVAAVTGACLAVARHKFEAVGGFNEENLPIDMNDVDLCLKLNARGWRTLWTPEAGLYHQEAASRGRTLHYAERYAGEREYMLSTWLDVIRDDPCFHPALSLYSRRVKLG